MSIRSNMAALAMIGALTAPIVAAPLVAQAAYSITLAEGDQINAQMQNTLDSANAYVGERFTLRAIPPYPQGDSDLANALITGKVIKVVQAGQGRKAELDVAFDTITLQNGTSYPINAQMTSKSLAKDSRNGGHVALTTIGGMIVGNILGKTIFHTNAGGAVGAAGGLLVGYNKKSNVHLASGTNITLTLVRPLVVRRQAGGY